LIGLLATLNGIVVQIIMGSRVLYGLAKQGWIHDKFLKLHKTNQTPIFATFFIVAAMILATLTLPIVSLAKATSLLLLSIFILVNASLISVKRKQKNHKGYITVPIAIPILGVICSSGLILYQILS
jgi:amino acid transporter